MIWIVIAVVLILIAVSLSIKNQRAAGAQTAKAIQERLRREAPNDELAELGEAEFAMKYQKAILAARRSSPYFYAALVFGIGCPLLGFGVMTEDIELAGWLTGVGALIGLLSIVGVFITISEQKVLEQMRSGNAKE